MGPDTFIEIISGLILGYDDLNEVLKDPSLKPTFGRISLLFNN